MKILLLDTGRGAGPETIATWRERLGLQPEDEVSLLGWNPPRQPLPVATHLVFGPDLRPYPAAPRSVATGPAAPTTPTPKVPVGAGPDAVADAAPQVTEQAPPPPERGAATGPAGSAPSPASTMTPTSGLPVYHPDRLRQAAKWRAAKARRFGTRAVGRARRELGKREIVSPERRRVLANNAISAEFGVAAVRSAQARALFAAADVVVPMDTRSQPAAWLLAKRIEGPDVVVGFPAAQRVIEGRRQA